MNQQGTLFDDTSSPNAGEGETVPFCVALLAFGAVRGLGHKGLTSLVGKLGEGLGNALRLPQAEILNLFSECDIKGAEKLAGAVAQDSAKLIANAESELARLETQNVHIVSPSHLPPRLTTTSMSDDAPKWLFVEGNQDAVLRSRLVIAVVGTRKPSDNGMAATRIIADIVGAYPIVLVSGLAEGIDGQAHFCSLRNDVPNLAFLGHGTNLVFPEDTAEIRREILSKGGAVISEYLPAQTYQKWQFVERNRLQAGLADLVIPVEAAASSGTSHTIRFARKYHRRLLGVRWEGANGIVDDLQANHDQLVDIFTDKGQKELDSIIHSLAKRELQDSYPFKILERMILREFGIRKYTEADIARLVARITTEPLPLEHPSDGRT